MTSPTNPGRPVPPTVREIAALTARLRDISARGRDVDPRERAAFLADKDALIARITDSNTHADDAASDAAEEWPAMPERMCQQTRAIEAAPDQWPAAVDDPAQLAERLAALRETRTDSPAGAEGTSEEELDRTFDELTERYPLPGDPDGDVVEGGPRGPRVYEVGPVDDQWWERQAVVRSAIWDDASPPAPRGALGPSTGARSSDSEQERREQLIRWHAEEDLADGFNDGCTCGDLARGDQ